MNPEIFKKLSCILNKKEKGRIVGLGVLVLIGGLLEMLGVSMIIPLAQAVMDTERLRQNEYVDWICSLLHIEDMNAFTILLLIAVICVFVVKNAYLLFLAYIQFIMGVPV